jgi:hypothetical protein
MHVKERGCEDRDWIELAQARDNLQAVVSTLMNFCFPYSEGVGWLGKELLVSQAASPPAQYSATCSTSQLTPARLSV